MSDWQIKTVEQAIAGNPKAFLKLCEDFARQITYVCIKTMGNQPDGEDAAQEVFIKMQKSIHALRQPETFPVWLNRIIHSVCTDQKRAFLKNERTVPLEYVAEGLAESRDDFLPAEYAENQALRRKLMQCIDRLSPQYRDVLLLYYYEGLCMHEIAAITERSEDAVEHTLRRARTKVKEDLGSTAPAGLAGVVPGTAVIGTAMQLEAAELIPLSGVPELIAASGVAKLGRLIAFVFSAKPALPVAAAVLAVSALAGGIVWATSTFGPAAPAGNPVPGISSTVVGGASGMADISGAGGTTGTDGNHGNAGAAGSGAAAGQPGQPGSVATPLAGWIVTQDSDGEPQHSPYGQGAVVELLSPQGLVVGSTTANADGQFTFSRLYISQNGTYTLRCTMPSSRSFSFASQNPQGVVTIQLVPGSAPKAEPLIYIADAFPPSLAINLYGADGAPSLANPAGATLLASDETEVTVRWEITAKGASSVLASGDTDSATIPPLGTGWYVMHAWATDEAGNTTYTSKEFYII